MTPSFPLPSAKVDQLRTKSIHRRMNNTINHHHRDRQQSNIVGTETLNSEMARLAAFALSEGDADETGPTAEHSKTSTAASSKQTPKTPAAGGGGSGAAGGGGENNSAHADDPVHTSANTAVAYQVAENLGFGLSTHKDLLYHFLLDDREGGHRGQRENLLNADFHHLGFSWGSHPSAESCSCLLLTDGSFFPKKPVQVRLDLAQE